jgi:CheY-like chemotaxis protein
MVQHAGQPGRFKVLLANEQEGWHQTVRRLLEPQGVQTISARSGREALELIESTPVHAAVLDVQMPQLGGMQVIRMMREMHRGQAGPGAGAKTHGSSKCRRRSCWRTT